MNSLTYESPSEDATRRFGEALGYLLVAGDFVALSGPLGAGKTRLVKGIARGLEVPEREPIVSPTFVLIREYVGRVRLYHADAYRLTSLDELAALGLEDFSGEDGVVVLEWADRFPPLIPPTAIQIDIESVDETRRRIRLTAPETIVRAMSAFLTGD